MKLIALIGTALVFLMNGLVFAASHEEILQNNEYGGITEILTYSAGDDEYKQGIEKMVTSYDHKGNKMSVEAYATDENSTKEGWKKTVTYYWGKETIGEVYSTDSHSAIYGFYRMVNYYDNDNKIYKREYFLRQDSIIGQLGVYKRVVYYDKEGRKTGFADLDRFNNPIEINLEEYQRIQRSKKN